MIRTRTKIEAVLAVAFLLAISISSVFAVTRTISDTSDTVYTQIICSNGNTYEATFANLVTACAIPNIEVKVPSCNITFTNTLYIASGVWLHGCGNSTVFWLGNNVNKTMIENVHHGNVVGGTYVANGVDNNICISDFTLNGNQYKQPKFRSDNWYRHIAGIRFTQTDNTSIQNVLIKNELGSAIHWISSRNLQINNYRASNIGLNWSTGIFTGYTQNHYVAGIYFEGCQNITVSDSFFNNIWNSGMIFEKSVLTSSPFYNMPTFNIKVVNCEFYKMFNGLWFETVSAGTQKQNAVITNCEFIHIDRTEDVYTTDSNEPTGILVSGSQVNINGCFFNYCGNASAHSGASVYLGGTDNILSNCIINNSWGNGTRVGGKNNTINDNHIENSGYDGIYYLDSSNSFTLNPIIKDNFIYNVGRYGIYVRHSTSAVRKINSYGNIDGNTIINPTSVASSYGIYCILANTSICGNTIKKFNVGIYTYDGGSTPNINRLTVSDNHIYDCFGLSTSSPYCGGIIIAGYRCVISNNVLYHCYHRAIWIAGTNNSIIGNTIDNVTISGTRTGIHLGSINGYFPAYNNTVLGNIVSGYSTGILESTSGDRNIFLGNICASCTTNLTTVGAKTLKGFNL